MNRNKISSKSSLKEKKTKKMQLSSVLKSGEPYADLHKKILTLLKILCATKAEYREVIEYPKPFLIISECIRMPNGEVENSESHRCEEALARRRHELAERLFALLDKLEFEYKLREKLETKVDLKLKKTVEEIKKEIRFIKTKLDDMS